MLRTSMFFLICALVCGVFGFGPAAVPTWLIIKGMFFVCLAIALTLLAYATVSERARLHTLYPERSIYF